LRGGSNIKVGCSTRIQVLHDSIASSVNINCKKNNSFFKSIKIVEDLEGSKIIRDSMLLPKYKLEEEMSIIRTSWEIEFESLIEFLEDYIKRWLVTFVNDNDDYLETIKKLRSYFK